METQEMEEVLMRKKRMGMLLCMILMAAALSACAGKTDDKKQGTKTAGTKKDESKEERTAKGESEKGMTAPDFEVTLLSGKTVKLSDYRGKRVLLNFWATWCGPCQREMPDIQKLYEKYGKNTGDVIVLGVANPKTKDAPNNQDQAEPGIVQYLSENGYSYPVLMDRTGALFSAYGITSFPTTFMIDQEGNVFGYVTGMLTADIMESIVRQTLEGRRP